MTNKTYTFTTVKEIADQLTVDQIDNFLIDFGSWLRFIKTGKSSSEEFDKLTEEMKKIVNAISKATGKKISNKFIDTSKFGWIDDGLHQKKLVITGGDEKIIFTIPEKKK